MNEPWATPSDPERANAVAAIAEQTFASIKQLNKAMNAKGTTALEREMLQQTIDLAKAFWWERVKPMVHADAVTAGE